MKIEIEMMMSGFLLETCLSTALIAAILLGAVLPMMQFPCCLLEFFCNLFRNIDKFRHVFLLCPSRFFISLFVRYQNQCSRCLTLHGLRLLLRKPWLPKSNFLNFFKREAIFQKFREVAPRRLIPIFPPFLSSPHTRLRVSKTAITYVNHFTKLCACTCKN